MKKAKVFGIGLSRTGTTSLNRALEILGYKSCHYPENLKEIDKFEAATDIPVVVRYKELDKMYPGSKFILTIREMDNWLTSMKLFYKKYPPRTRSKETLQIRRKAYGTIVFEEKKMRQAYKKHLKDVKNYFKNRKKDLLVLDICASEGWEKLCPFLKKSLPKKRFPKLNIGKK